MLQLITRFNRLKTCIVSTSDKQNIHTITINNAFLLKQRESINRKQKEIFAYSKFTGPFFHLLFPVIFSQFSNCFPILLCENPSIALFSIPRESWLKQILFCSPEKPNQKSKIGILRVPVFCECQ